jgi:hypothetical protein
LDRSQDENEIIHCIVETPVKKFTKATGQTVYRQIV